MHGRRRLVWTITAFTAGHSVTLSLAILGIVAIPPQPVEVLIAVTIVVVAVERIPAYAIGSMAVFWVSERVAGML